MNDLTAPMSRAPAKLLQGRKLVVFDVDGTLYNQKGLRRAMAVRLLAHLALTGRVSTLNVLATYRRIRETTADQECADFESAALAGAAQAGKIDEMQARDLVAEWMHKRPLPLLAHLRYPGVAELFDSLRRQGMIIGILSDHPAAAKLDAMNLTADVITYAGAAGVPLQKPDPCGLLYLMQATDASPAETLMIGDRDDRDGDAARRAGVDVLIRADRPNGPYAFRSFAALIGSREGHI